MKSWILAIVAALCFASPALAVDPPLYVLRNNYSTRVIEIDVLVSEIDHEFYGSVYFNTSGGPVTRTYKLNQISNSKTLAIINLLMNNVGNVVRVEGVEFQSYVRLASGTVNQHGLLLVDASVIPAP